MRENLKEINIMVGNLCKLPVYSRNTAGIQTGAAPHMDMRSYSHRYASLWAAAYATYALSIPSYYAVIDELTKTRHNTTFKLTGV